MREYILVFLRGIAMGAADVVPGVSGGTIAFISGIYDRLLASIAACTPDKLLWLLRGRFREAWQAIDGGFLFTLLAGILCSIATLARVISYLLAEHDLLVWSFFFGLILVSVYLVGREIQRWNLWAILAAVGGVIFAYLIIANTRHSIFNKMHPFLCFIFRCFPFWMQLFPFFNCLALFCSQCFK